jgi:hypothetical protein
MSESNCEWREWQQQVIRELGVRQDFDTDSERERRIAFLSDYLTSQGLNLCPRHKRWRGFIDGRASGAIERRAPSGAWLSGTFRRRAAAVRRPARSSDKDVKAFARHMMMDHTKLTVQLKMAAPKGVTVPKGNSDTSVLHWFKPLKELDNAYISKFGMEGHKQAVDAFQEGDIGRAERRSKEGRSESIADDPAALSDGTGSCKAEGRSG